MDRDSYVALLQTLIIAWRAELSKLEALKERTDEEEFRVNELVALAAKTAAFLEDEFGATV